MFVLLCDRCNENEAIIHIKKVINGSVTEIHLCEVCAKETKESEMKSSPVSFQDFLLGLMDVTMKELSEEKKNEQEDINYVTCPRCGMSYKVFKLNGKFGCADCYKVFDKQIAIMLKKVHGNVNHTGKTPKNLQNGFSQGKNIIKLKEALKDAVANEEFETAAKLRDMIKEIERGN